MKDIFKLLLIASTVFVVSCTQSTEKYAKKEHGIKFNAWELRYNADDYDVYWPSLSLTEPVSGEITEIETKRHWWTNEIISRDTTTRGARLKATIRNVKCRNDAKYYNTINFRVCDEDGNYRYRLEHRFLFNEGQKDSIFFSATANDNGNYIPSRDVSEKIITLMSGNNPVNVKVSFNGSSIEGVYSFKVEGSPKLSKGLELDHDRKVLAEKESKKEENKLEKELEELFN